MSGPEILHALRPFVGTERGQISVDIDTELQLLSDTHWYWWFVRNGRTGGEGFVPAEIVELPNERLARLNRQMNIHLPSATLGASCERRRSSKSVRFSDLSSVSSTTSVSSMESLELDDDTSALESSDSEESLLCSPTSGNELDDVHIDGTSMKDTHKVHILSPSDGIDAFRDTALGVYH